MGLSACSRQLAKGISMRTNRRTLLAGGLGLMATPVLAADWPQFRGPGRTGISTETGLLKEWPQGGPRLVWQRQDLGDGYSSVAASGGKLYAISNKGMDNEMVHALDAATGRTLWSTKIGVVGAPMQQPAYPGSRSTPTVSGGMVYALGSDGDLVCLEAAGGKVVWQHHVRKEFGGAHGVWAYSESPLVDGDRVICTPGGETTLLAVDKRTGAVAWRSQAPGGDQAGYSSVVAATVAGVRQYVQFVQKGVIGVEAAGGKFLWRYDRTAMNSPANIPTPVVDGDLVYTASGRGGCALIRIRANGGALAAEEVYFNPRLPSAIGGSVKVGENLYGTSGTGLMCVNFADGAIRWQDRCVGAGAIAVADGRIYVFGENGEAALVEAAGDGYREKGRFRPSNPPERGQSKSWAYPVVANGRLYLRELGCLWCYDIKAA